jgi:hypothetical protein
MARPENENNRVSEMTPEIMARIQEVIRNNVEDLHADLQRAASEHQAEITEISKRFKK